LVKNSVTYFMDGPFKKSTQRRSQSSHGQREMFIAGDFGLSVALILYPGLGLALSE